MTSFAPLLSKKCFVEVENTFCLLYAEKPEDKYWTIDPFMSLLPGRFIMIQTV